MKPPYTILPWYKQLFCKHYYVIFKQESSTVARQLNSHGYGSSESQCRLCGKIIEHD